MKTRTLQVRWTAIALLCLAATAQAQQAPDAGTLLRQQPASPAPASPPPLIPGPPPVAPEEVMTGPRFVVKAFRFTGAVMIPEADLQAHIAAYRGHRVTFGILRLIADQLTGYYLRRGFLARVLIPEQDVKDGVVEFRVIEGQRGSLTIENQGKRVDGGRVTDFINQRLGEGAAFDVSRLNEAIAILNEQPGVRAGTTLRPGTREGEVAVVVSTADKPLFEGTAALNNSGSKASGVAVGQVVLSLANPTGSFDAASLSVNASEGNTFGRIDYSLAVGNRGLRVGANAAALRYRIIDPALKPLDLHGTARTFGLAASYPLARTRTFGLDLAASHGVKRLIDQSATGETGNRTVTATTLGLSGSLRHRIGRKAALTRFGADVVFGEGDERNAGALAADAAARRTNGGFSKLAYNAANLVEISENWSHAATLRGQLAGNNLDSSERFGLGGPSGIRGYPVGEGTGDEGWLLSLNLRRSFGNELAASLFYDAGGVTLNRETWANWNAGNANLPNRYTLAGVGAGIDWRFLPSAVLSVTLAVPVGSNPGRDTNNLNADGKRNHARLLLVLSAEF